MTTGPTVCVYIEWGLVREGRQALKVKIGQFKSRAATDFLSTVSKCGCKDCRTENYM